MGCIFTFLLEWRKRSSSNNEGLVKKSRTERRERREREDCEVGRHDFTSQNSSNYYKKDLNVFQINRYTSNSRDGHLEHKEDMYNCILKYLGSLILKGVRGKKNK